MNTVILGILLPFFGTALGSSAVFLRSGRSNAFSLPYLNGFAGGVMLAASVWSLLLPSIERSEGLEIFSFFPAAAGFFIGSISMLLCDRLTEKLIKKRLSFSEDNHRKFITAFAVTIHNLPEGMAVGAAFSPLLTENKDLALAGAISLSLGVALQNLPEGAIVSLPLLNKHSGKCKAFSIGVLSGLVEPLGAAVMLIFSGLLFSLLPIFLSLAAGAMIYVVMTELSKELADGNISAIISFTAGFIVMMSLDVALG